MTTDGDHELRIDLQREGDHYIAVARLYDPTHEELVPSVNWRVVLPAAAWTGSVAGDPSLAGHLFGHEAFVLALAAARARVEQGKGSLYVRLEMAADDPATTIAWEAAVDPRAAAAGESRRLFAGERVCFARSIPPLPDEEKEPWRPARATADARVLVAIAAPDPAELDEGWPATPIDRAGEVDRIKAALAGFLAVDVLPAPGSLDAIGDQLSRHAYDVLYLMCHGRLVGRSREPQLLLENAAGRPEPVAADRLVALLGGLAHRPSLVFLASCESAGAPGRGGLVALGPRLVRTAGIPAVIAMMDRVERDTASAFGAAFFRALGRTGNVMTAASLGRQAIATHPDWSAPVLFTRSMRDRVFARLFEKDYTAEAVWQVAAESSARRMRDAQAKVEINEDLYVHRDLELEVETFFRSPKAVMVITGQSGMGKTTLVARVLRRQAGEGDLCFFISSADVPYDITRVDATAAGAPALEVLFQATIGSSLPAPVLLAAIERECGRRRQRCIIAIDALNEFNRRREGSADDSPLRFLAKVDELGRQIHDARLEHIKLIVTSRPELWRRGPVASREHVRASNDAYHVTHGAIDHVLERYSENEAIRAYVRYTRPEQFDVRTPYSNLTGIVRYQLRDPLVLKLTCQVHTHQELPDELDSGLVFERYDDFIRGQTDGAHLVGLLDRVAGAMFDATGVRIERDSISIEGQPLPTDPRLHGDLNGTFGNTLADDLNVLRREGGTVRFTYDRYAEYRLSRRLLGRIGLMKPPTRPAEVLALIQNNLDISFRLTTVFRALRRTLRHLAETEDRFIDLANALLDNERGLALVGSVLAGLASRKTVTTVGIEVVDRLLAALQRRVDKGRKIDAFHPVIDLVYRMLLDEEYAGWLAAHAEKRSVHYPVFDQRFLWGIRHINPAVSGATVQYLFFLWQSPFTRYHADRITGSLIANAPAIRWVLIRARDRSYFRNLTGALMLALAEARTEDAARPVLRHGAALLQRVRAQRSFILGALQRLPRVLTGLFVKGMLSENTNPVNYEALEVLFGKSKIQDHVRQSIALLRPGADWSGVTHADLARLAQTRNAFALQIFCFVLSVRWERLAHDEAARREHLARLCALFASGTASVRYCIALVLYHINYFGDHATLETIATMRAMVEHILAEDRGHFSFEGRPHPRYDTNVIGTFGRVIARHQDSTLRSARQVPDRPVLEYALNALIAAKRAGAAKDYLYICNSMGLLGILAHPRDVFELIEHVLTDLGQFPGTRSEVPLPRDWSKETTDLLRTRIKTALANIRVLYREEVDRYVLDVLNDQTLYTEVATQVQPEFHLATFYSWTSEHLMYQIFTRYHAQVGEAYLDALLEALEEPRAIGALEVTARRLLERLQSLAEAGATR